MLLHKISDFGLTQKSKNRNSLEIVRDMLSAASAKTKKTRIMYSAHLSYRLMEKYMNTLLENGLIERIDGSSYLITWKGKNFLQMYNDYLEQCRRVRQEIRGVRKDRMLLENMCFSNEAESKHMAKKEEVFV